MRIIIKQLKLILMILLPTATVENRSQNLVIMMAQLPITTKLFNSTLTVLISTRIVVWQR